ncbi:MAG: hypothetical protein ACJAUL_003937 [Paraglaciecola sp.]|jgi:hypothetical protein
MKKLFTAAALLMASINVLAVPIVCSSADTATTYCVSDKYGEHGNTQDAQVPSNGLNTSLTIAAFDDLGGTRTLTGVVINVFGSVDSAGTIKNNIASPTYALASVATPFTFAPWQVKTNEITSEFGALDFSDQSSDVVRADYDTEEEYNADKYNLNQDDEFNWDFTTGLIENSDAFSALDISVFNSDVMFNYSGYFQTVFEGQIDSGNANYSTIGSTASFGAVEAIYTYETSASPVTAVPEPVSILMFGLGLIGLSQTRKAKKCLIG